MSKLLYLKLNRKNSTNYKVYEPRQTKHIPNLRTRFTLWKSKHGLGLSKGFTDVESMVDSLNV